MGPWVLISGTWYKFTMVEPAQKMESLKDLTGTEFSEQARSVLDALGVLKGICGCPN